MNVKVDNTTIILNVKRNIFVNSDISLVLQNSVNLYETDFGRFNYEIEEVDLIYIYVKGKQFQYESFGKVKSYIKLIYDIDINETVDSNEYTDEYSHELGEYIAQKYNKVLKIN